MPQNPVELLHPDGLGPVSSCHSELAASPRTGRRVLHIDEVVRGCRDKVVALALLATAAAGQDRDEPLRLAAGVALHLRDQVFVVLFEASDLIG